MPYWARRLTLGLIATGAVVALVWGGQSISVPIPPAEFKDCVEAQKAQKAQKRPPTLCKTHETMWERTLRDPVAYYTLWLTIFTGALALVGVAQWGAIARQLALGQEEFVATHRPRIRVRRLEENSQSPDGNRATFLVVSNVGESRATITGVAGAIGVRFKDTKKWLPPGMNLSSAKELPASPQTVLLGGEQRTYGFRSAGPTQDDYFVGPTPQCDLMAVGEIIYRDDNGVTRRTGFAWYWDMEVFDWLPAQDPMNYED